MKGSWRKSLAGSGRPNRRQLRRRSSRCSSSSRAWEGRSRPSCSECCRRPIRRRAPSTRPQRRPPVSCSAESVGQVKSPGLVSGPPATAARPAVSATTPHTRVARPACPWRAGAPASTGERGPSLAKERLEVRESLRARTILIPYVPFWCDRIAHVCPCAPQALGQLVDSLSPDEVAALRDQLDHVQRRTVHAPHAAPR